MSVFQTFAFLSALIALASSTGCATRKGGDESLPPEAVPAAVAAPAEEAPEPAPAVEEEPAKRRWSLFTKNKKKDRPEASEPAAGKEAETRLRVNPQLSAPPLPAEGDAAFSNSAYRLKREDQIRILLSSIPRDVVIEDVIDENGFVTLPHIGKMRAVGRSTSELEDVIRETYIDQKIYRDLTVTVLMATKSYYVRGEVKKPGTYALESGLTLSQAVAAAGGYTEFANRKKLLLTRNNRTRTINMKEVERDPSTDEELEAGDVIVVKRRIW